MVEELGLPKDTIAPAILADGQLVEVPTFRCSIDWFDITFDAQDHVTEGEYPLLGAMLLDGHRLQIDYAARTVEIK